MTVTFLCAAVSCRAEEQRIGSEVKLVSDPQPKTEDTAMNREDTPLLTTVPTAGPKGTGTPRRQLNTFFGVMVPTVLSMFSIVLFLRTGFVVGHAGLLQALFMLCVSYFIISLTVLSVCAISTNGAVKGGGAYYMISRSLGPEFGGSIGLMFYLAKVCACGEYLLGLVEAILSTFGRDSDLSGPIGIRTLPQGYWYTVLYASALLLFCMLVCLVGAHIYSRAAFLTLLVVSVALLSVLLSALMLGPRSFLISHQGGGNHTRIYNATYTGLSSATLKSNLGSEYTLDYSTNSMMTFASVFAVMFTSCTGIMAGANMSGELMNPSVSIPKGTITAVVYAFLVYLLLFLLVASTCDRVLLTQDYSFLQRINLWPPFIMVGVYMSSLSAAMCSLIGASRILHALAADKLFGLPLAPAAVTSRSGNPWVSVLYTWAMVQCVLFAGQLNAIASLVTVFYLLAFAAVDLACLALEWASAPNFRPTFQHFSWHTCLLGILSCLVMMFVINPAYSSASLVILMVLLLFLHYRAPTSSWGYISQALIFHQVRKYLLMLDVRKEHVKFWRPQVLLMVSNPRSSCQLISFINQLKKGGLFVLGHVQLGDLDALPSDPIQHHYTFWLCLVDKLGVKAFVDLTLSPSVRQGTQHLLRITGLGGMKPNTLVLGFYDDSVPTDYFLQNPPFTRDSWAGRGGGANSFLVDWDTFQSHFPPVQGRMAQHCLSPSEYVGLVSDAIKMGKNVCLARYFHLMEETGGRGHIDVWPLEVLQPQGEDGVDVSVLFLLQMACVLSMSSRWRRATLRVFLCGGAGWAGTEEVLRELLGKLRIRARVQTVQVREEPKPDGTLESALNSLLVEHSGGAAVRFVYLPRPPTDSSQSLQYLAQLDTVTRNLGPTLLIHGVTPVTYTEL